jgi:integrase
LTKRRSRGDGGLRWSDARQRWIAEVTVGWKPDGKRIVKSASGKTKTEAKNALKDILRDTEDGSSAEAHNFTVGDAVRDWLTYGLSGRDPETVTKLTILANTHILPVMGNRRLTGVRGKPGLSADEVDEWLADKAQSLATRTLQDLHSILRRSIMRAQKREKVKRNVVQLCEVPAGKDGRPSKSLNYEQAQALLTAAEQDESAIGTYIIVSLLNGPRTEEARPLRWRYVDLEGKPDADPPEPPHVKVWRSVRAHGDTKTKKSRRSVALAARSVAALKAHKRRQTLLREARLKAGKSWADPDIVFATEVGTEMDAANVRRGLRRIAKAAGLNPKEWTPRELRHSFVSLLSDGGLSVEKIALLIGHSGTAVTEKVYRHQIRPVIRDESRTIDRLFPDSVA